MPLLSLTDPVNATTTDANLIASNNTAIENLVNGQLDSSNLAAAILGALVPPGVMVPFAGASAPSGWLLCDGTSYTTAGQPALFAAIGYTWGGAGANFNIPDMRDQTAVGKSGTKALGSSGGTANETLNSTQIPLHTHPVNAESPATGGRSAAHTHGMSQNIVPNRQGTQIGNVVEIIGPSGAYTTGVSMDTESADHSHTVNSHSHGGATQNNAGGGGSHNNLPPYKALNFIIKT